MTKKNTNSERMALVKFATLLVELLIQHWPF